MAEPSFIDRIRGMSVPNLLGGGQEKPAEQKSFVDQIRDQKAPNLLGDSRDAAARTGTPATFVAQYLPLAEKVGSRLGVSPKILLAQWGGETGWGKSIISGTNNLGNIMDFSGKGPKAVDNYNGRTDSYRAYKNVDEFGNDFAGVIERVHKGAMNSGDDPARYFRSLQKSGYAEHPEYVNTGIKATRMVDRELQKLRGQKISDASDVADEYNPVTQVASADEYEQAWNEPDDGNTKALA